MPAITPSRVTHSSGWRDERGALSPVETGLLIVMVAVLTAIAGTAYLAMQHRSQDTGARTDLQQIVRSIEDYYTETGTYAGIELPALKARYDRQLDASRYRLSGLGESTYCVEIVGARRWHKVGPAGDVARGSCP